MNDLAQAVHDTLAGDDTLADMLATYEHETGTAAPAIFDGLIPPDDALLPAVSFSLSGATRWDTIGQGGYTTSVDVRAYANKTGSRNTLRAIGERIYELFHGQRIEVENHEEWGWYADAPIAADDPDGYPGVLVGMRVNLLRK